MRIRIIANLVIFLGLVFPLTDLCPEGRLHAAGLREPAVAGRFYPGSEKALKQTVLELLQKAPAAGGKGRTAALISPHAGYLYSGQTAAYGYRAIQGESFRTILLLGPSHTATFHGLSIPDVEAYRTPLGKVPLDQAVARALRKHPLILSHPAAHDREHAIEVQLPFLQTLLPDAHIVPILTGRLNNEDYPELARVIREHLDETTLIIASSDFTHYGPRYQYVPFHAEVQKNLSQLDHEAFRIIQQQNRNDLLDFQARTGDTICGLRPIALLLEILSKQESEAGRLLHYSTSGAVTDDFTNSVSYASILFKRRDPIMYLTPDEKKTLLRLARQALESYVRESTALESPPQGIQLTDRLKEPAGAFVTLEKEKQLRGCIGYIEPIRPLYQAIMDNAVSACAKDYRFSPVKASELDQIQLEISVLTPKQEVSGPEAFIPGRHGIIIEKNGKRAVFLPQVAEEQGWNREQTLQHLCRKAGLSMDAWKKDCRFWIFTAELFSEEEHE